MAHRWNMVGEFTPDEKRIARRHLRKQFPDGPPENFELNRDSYNQMIASGTSNTGQATNTSGTTGRKGKNANTSGDGDSSSDGNGDAPSSEGDLLLQLQELGLTENLSLRDTGGYGFATRGKLVASGQTIVDKFKSRWNHEPTSYHLLKGIVILGPIPATNN